MSRPTVRPTVWPVWRDAAGRYAVATDHVPDEAVALERDLAAAQALAARLNEGPASPAPQKFVGTPINLP